MALLYRGFPLDVADPDASTLDRPAHRAGSPNSHSWLAAPLLVKNQMIGMLSLGHQQAQYYDREALHIVQAFANQGGHRDCQCRLYQQAQELATAEERTRLAHELHDSVTQTLFSANLIAHALPDALAVTRRGH